MVITLASYLRHARFKSRWLSYVQFAVVLFSLSRKMPVGWCLIFRPRPLPLMPFATQRLLSTCHLTAQATDCASESAVKQANKYINSRKAHYFQPFCTKKPLRLEPAIAVSHGTSLQISSAWVCVFNRLDFDFLNCQRTTDIKAWPIRPWALVHWVTGSNRTYSMDLCRSCSSSPTALTPVYGRDTIYC